MLEYTCTKLDVNGRVKSERYNYKAGGKREENYRRKTEFHSAYQYAYSSKENRCRKAVDCKNSLLIGNRIK
jgi:hypothetical protein